MKDGPAWNPGWVFSLAFVLPKMKAVKTLFAVASLWGTVAVARALSADSVLTRSLSSRQALLQDVLAEPCTLGYCTQNGGWVVQVLLVLVLR
jgi:hypothetical protein